MSLLSLALDLGYADFLSLLKLILYRSRTRQGSYETRNLLGLMSVTIFAAMSRVLLFSIWLYVFNNGQFSSIMTLIAYYTFFSMIIVFHIVVNKKKPVFSFPFVLGLLNVELLLDFWPTLTFAEVVLNSLSSVIKYNEFELESVLSKNQKSIFTGGTHEATFVKQTIYILLVTMINLG